MVCFLCSRAAKGAVRPAMHNNLDASAVPFITTIRRMDALRSRPSLLVVKHEPLDAPLNTPQEPPLITPAKLVTVPPLCGPDTPVQSTPPPKLDQLAEQVRRTSEMLARLQNMVQGVHEGREEFTAAEATQPLGKDSTLSSESVAPPLGACSDPRAGGAGFAVGSRKRLFGERGGEVERGANSNAEGQGVVEKVVCEKRVPGIVEAAEVLLGAPDGQSLVLDITPVPEMAGQEESRGGEGAAENVGFELLPGTEASASPTPEANQMQELGSLLAEGSLFGTERVPVARTPSPYAQSGGPAEGPTPPPKADEVAPQNPRTLFNGVCVKTEWVDEPLGLETRGSAVNGHPGSSGNSGMNEQLAVNGHTGLYAGRSGVNGHSKVDDFPPSEPIDDDSGSGLEDNDHGFDSEPEEAAAEEPSFGEPVEGPRFFAESEEEKSESERETGDIGGWLKAGWQEQESKTGSARDAITPAEKQEWLSYEGRFQTCFMRVMLPSFVTSGCWLGLPATVADQFMKRGEYSVTFRSEGTAHTVNWLFRPPEKKAKRTAPSSKGKPGFSGGWKGFAEDHGLVPGDSVLFEKNHKYKFSLHLFRRCEYGGSVKRAAEAANRKGAELDATAAGGSDGGQVGGVMEMEETRAGFVSDLKLNGGERRHSETDGHHTRQKKLTEDFPVVKRQPRIIRKGTGKKRRGKGDGGNLRGEETKAVDGADVTADGAGGSSGEPGGPKRVKRRRDGPGRVLTSAGRIMTSRAPGGAGSEHFVTNKDTVHYRYEEASENGQRRAKKAMEECLTAYPNVKMVMSKSHVDKGFWLGGFTYLSCETHLQTDQPVALVDSRGGVWHALLLHDASGLSGGWRGFSIDHRLEVGDALVFEMVFPYVFHVRIFKASRGGKEEDCTGATGTRERRIRAAGRVQVGEKRKVNEAQLKVLAALLNLPDGLPPERDYSQGIPLPELGPAPPRKVAKLSDLAPNAKAPNSSTKARADESGPNLASTFGNGRPRIQPVRGGPVVKLEKVERTPLEETQGVERDLVGGEEIRVGEGPGAKRRRGSETEVSLASPAPKQLKKTAKAKTSKAKTGAGTPPRSLGAAPGKTKKGELHFEKNPKNRDPESGRRRHLEEVTGRVYVEPSKEQIAAAAAAAQKAAKRIPAERLPFVLDMKTSHVDRVFWRGLPPAFLDALDLPRDCKVYLQNARGFVWEATLLIEQQKGLSGGWRKFAVDHQLEFGDHVILDVREKVAVPNGSDAVGVTILVRIFRAKWDGREDDCRAFAFVPVEGKVVGKTTAYEGKRENGVKREPGVKKVKKVKKELRVTSKGGVKKESGVKKEKRG
ncbi:hypothetical protein KFL_003930120 [Klebsormidium nitens]|uniref:TF-B3 domain-containing protein n=1 Tax=Klebsormidium nitens TaxID=105231 RepID=A0A0U9HN27_KLENI|nr:hypothetical protein KFL_003930120 [Klebsormidium nitens]|eukprot:GAQ88008.1 hypothetical protein KFL_003930120 [Klebsormidium nitens]